jgi:hypothetical protein
MPGGSGETVSDHTPLAALVNGLLRPGSNRSISPLPRITSVAFGA